MYGRCLSFYNSFSTEQFHLLVIIDFLFIIYNWLHPNRTEGVVIAGMIIKLSDNYAILTSIVLRGPVFFFPPNVFMNLAESVRPFGSLLVLL